MPEFRPSPMRPEPEFSRRNSRSKRSCSRIRCSGLLWIALLGMNLVLFWFVSELFCDKNCTCNRKRNRHRGHNRHRNRNYKYILGCLGHWITRHVSMTPMPPPVMFHLGWMSRCIPKQHKGIGLRSMFQQRQQQKPKQNQMQMQRRRQMQRQRQIQSNIKCKCKGEGKCKDNGRSSQVISPVVSSQRLKVWASGRYVFGTVGCTL